MNIDEMNIFCSMDRSVILSIEKNSTLPSKLLAKRDCKKLMAMITSSETKYTSLIVQGFSVMHLSQIHSISSYLLTKHKKEFVQFLNSISGVEDKFANALRAKIKICILHNMLKNTVVDLNVLDLKKTIAKYEQI